MQFILIPSKFLEDCQELKKVSYQVICIALTLFAGDDEAAEDDEGKEGAGEKEDGNEQEKGEAVEKKKKAKKVRKHFSLLYSRTFKGACGWCTYS